IDAMSLLCQGPAPIIIYDAVRLTAFGAAALYGATGRSILYGVDDKYRNRVSDGRAAQTPSRPSAARS
ncbi:hypothetical protein, partial [Sphingomonas oligophenolica]|uniref:hypothetical protein n=1 Tax=Sphingomonas oligophenolica TaxID=301154 RepID=UPI0031D6A0C8